MNLQEINNKISQIPVDQMKVIKTFCRPPEKSNEILEVALEGQKFYCERPRYHWSRLDQSLIAKSFTTEGQRVFGPKQETGFFDQRGLWWTTKKLCSLYLIPHYLQKPLKFIRIMSQHMVDSQQVIRWLKQINQNKDDDHKLIENLELMRKIYYKFYLYEASVFFVYDELVYRFKKLLVKHLDKKGANTYLVQFMQAEMTKEALKRRMNEKIVYERPDSRGVLYAAGTEPQVYYRRPKYFHQSDDDMRTLEELVKKQLVAKELERFLAFRLIIPVAVQVNEEAQYIESQMMSGHMSYLLKKVSQKLNKNLDNLDQMTIEEIIVSVGEVLKPRLPGDRKSVLTGIPASPGRARGRVRIVPEGQMNKDFNQGDILVTKITDPSMVMMMAKTAAIVCDIGGLTSHPAIVSREMGIPCVVGTKDGTQKLKDGDEVIVDGNKGEIYLMPDSVGEDLDPRLPEPRLPFGKPYPQWIDDWAEAYWQGCGKGMDINTIRPLNYYKFHPLYGDLWLDKIYRAMKLAGEKKIPFRQIVEKFPNPSSVRAIFQFLTTRLQYISNLIDEQIKCYKKVIKFVYEILKAKTLRDHFALKENIAHGGQEIEQLIEDTNWHQGTPMVAKDLGRLFLGLMTYINATFNDVVTDNGVEAYGPYDVSSRFGPNHILVIRDYPRLKPVELWSELANQPYKQIQILTIYKNLSLRIELFGVHTIFEGDVINNLVKYKVLIDGRCQSHSEQIKKPLNHFLTSAKKHYQIVKKMDLEALKQKALEQECYQLKDFFELVGLDWRPSEEKRQRVKDADLLHDIFQYKPGDSRQKFEQEFGIEFLRKIFSK